MSQTKNILPIRRVKEWLKLIQCIYESGFVTSRFQERYILFNPSRVVLTVTRKGSPGPCKNIQPCCYKDAICIELFERFYLILLHKFPYL